MTNAIANWYRNPAKVTGQHVSVIRGDPIDPALDLEFLTDTGEI